MATIQVRVSDEDKAEAEKVLKALGIDLTTAIRVYLKRITVDGGIPFPVNNRLTVNGFTPEFEAEVLEAEKDIKGSKTFDNVEDLMKDLDS
ncbi:type II toxin-antitoxin system RelB/DinJ family antitoxin [Patescibacteria group bacterium]|nr:type II toxin-antitoxin system RelB/DinJ family antitoxin [Patescibacteria group bacterium]MBU1123093.1 type II toxin-antitoxin system RelB/DinJ family antitoxin [Patescibacteria group bacterium]MBU1911430.1 type II toxin-antitoxin system RelB/DinJ family antitoxin [Patescibacteria group bacterium]